MLVFSYDQSSLRSYQQSQQYRRQKKQQMQTSLSEAGVAEIIAQNLTRCAKQPRELFFAHLSLANK